MKETPKKNAGKKASEVITKCDKFGEPVTNCDQSKEVIANCDCKYTRRKGHSAFAVAICDHKRPVEDKDSAMCHHKDANNPRGGIRIVGIEQGFLFQFDDVAPAGGGVVTLTSK